MNNTKNKLLYRMALAAFLLTIVVVVLGAFTRLVDAGLGCPDWPGCYGHLLWPNDAQEIAQAEKKFPGAPVELDKTWPEMVHRYFAGTLGLFILAITITALIKRKEESSDVKQSVPIKLSVFLLLLVIVQAAFGMWTVTLKLWPQVVTAHLLGGFATLSLLWLLTQRLSGAGWRLSFEEYYRLQKVKPLLLLCLFVVIFQIALGGWVSSNYAALACPDFPQCLGQWVPPMDLGKGFNLWQDIGPNYLGGQLDNHSRTAIHYVHRLGAIVVIILLIILGLRLWGYSSVKTKSWVFLLWLVLLTQVALGISNVVFSLPLNVAVAHNAVGALLLLTLVTLCHRIFTAKLFYSDTGK